MGACCSVPSLGWCFVCRNKTHGSILLLGLDGSGKSTILQNLKGETQGTATRDNGFFNVETVEHKDISFNLWDLGGSTKARSLWEHFYSAAQGVMFAIDSADRERIGEAKSELHRALLSADLSGIPLLILANKQDIAGAMKIPEIEESLELGNLGEREWQIKISSANTGEGLYEGLDWLASVVRWNAST